MRVRAIAIGAAGAAVLVASGAGTALLLTSSESLTASTVPPPANVSVETVTTDRIVVSWGPTLPGVFTAGAATPSSLVIRWGPSQDSHGPVTYTLRKNKTISVTGISRLYAKVGFTRAVRVFRTCVWATNVQGKTGPEMCATWNGTAPAPPA